MKKQVLAVLAASGLALSLVSPASAAVTFDSNTGKGFAGKGDVQLVFGWNNRALNDNAGSLEFAYVGTTVTEVSWECTNSKNQKIQERERTTTTETQGVVTHIARDNKKQITGFILDSYEDFVNTTSATEGPKLNSCPAAEGNWSLTLPAGDPEVISSTGGLTVTSNGATHPLPLSQATIRGVGLRGRPLIRVPYR